MKICGFFNDITNQTKLQNNEKNTNSDTKNTFTQREVTKNLT